MLIPTLLVGGCLYYFIFTVMAEQIGLPDLMAKDLYPVIQRINMILAGILPVILLLLLTWAVLLSRRFVAPLERLEEDIKKIVAGDYSVKVEIQEDHDLKPVADAVNSLVAELKKGREK